MSSNKHGDFCIFILSHGRPDNVITYRILKKSGCSYPIYLIIDDEDKKADRYYENFGKKNVVMFNKASVKFDMMDNFKGRNCVVFARNASFDIAKKLGYKYFLQLDDDYTAFSFMYDHKDRFKRRIIKNIDKVFDAFLDYYKSVNVKTMCFLQGGDLFGGGGNSSLTNNIYPFEKRKAMNSFFCSTERVFEFTGRINEDVNAYSRLGNIGDLFMSIPLVTLNQHQTQKNEGGLTDIYLSVGTYVKSFYTVLARPDSYKVALMGSKKKRLHHLPTWVNVVPKILREECKK